MSQHTFSIANESGAAFRADVNSALQALASCSRGATAPATMYAAQVWDDSTANVQKKRNTANSAWIVKMTLDETFALARSSNTILGLSDIGKEIHATGTFTQTLTAAATLGDGWFIDYRNDGTGLVTLDPNASEQIDGVTTLKLYPGEGCRIWCNGAAFKTIGRTPGLVLIQKQAASASATIDFTAGIDSAFDDYELHFDSVVAANADDLLLLRVSTDGGGTWKSAAASYQSSKAALGETSGLAALTSTAQTSIRVVQSGISAAGVSPCHGIVRFRAPSNAAFKPRFFMQADFINSTDTITASEWGSGLYATAGAINGVRMFCSSGNITSGNFSLYGVRKGA